MEASLGFKRQLEGFGITTARITYRMPDYRSIFQEFIWQEYDVYPDFPELKKFLNFWERKLDGPLHSVTVAHQRLIRPSEIRNIDGGFVLH